MKDSEKPPKKDIGLVFMFLLFVFVIAFLRGAVLMDRDPLSSENITETVTIFIIAIPIVLVWYYFSKGKRNKENRGRK